MVCKQCGAKVLDGDRFCLNCGSEIDVEVENEAKLTDDVTSSDGSVAEETQESKDEKAGAAFGVLSVLMGIVLTVLFVILALKASGYGVIAGGVMAVVALCVTAVALIKQKKR